MCNLTMRDNHFKAIYIISTIVVCSVLAVVVCITGCVTTKTTNDNLYELVKKGNTRTMVLASRKTGNNLFRKASDWRKRVVYIPVHSQPSNNSISQEKLDRPFQPQDEQKVKDFQAEDKYLEDANRRLEHELGLIRNKSN